MIKQYKIIVILLCIILSTDFSNAEEPVRQQSKYPDYAYAYLGPDKFEKMNRKIFAFNLGLNKYAIRPVHILWSSIMPEYGIERIQYAYRNIEYPKRLVSNLIQGDFKTCGTETVRFLTNTTIGVGGMFDPAKKYFKIEPSTEDMEQALTKCKCNSGSYIVLPVISGTTPRGAAGKLLDISLNPTTYVATPVLAMVKAGLTVNRTSYIQPFIKMIESTYADPYDIAKKAYGIDNYIKCQNYDRKEILEKAFKEIKEPQENNYEAPEFVEHKQDLIEAQNEPEKKEHDGRLTVTDIVQCGSNIDNVVLNSYNANNSKLMADMILFDYNPQNPVVDSMRTALFSLPEIHKSMWNELSIWNRSFAEKIKTSSVNITPDKENYKFRYIMQKDKNSPVAIIYPSIGEGIMSEHSVIFAKIFYDAGYSVIIQGSHFQWEFVKSMPDTYKPGIPPQDAEYLKLTTAKIIDKLEKKYNCTFKEKMLFGTSFGALTTLFLADKEYKENTLGITKYISVCPPVELLYAMDQVDKNSEEWSKNPNDLKNRVAITAAKIIQLLDMKENNQDINLEILRFSEEEGKIITGFIMHQKLSDLIFTLEKTPTNKKTDIYQTINNMNYRDYAQKYLLNANYKTFNDLGNDTSLLSLTDFLQNSNNYKIYHSLDDYLVNQSQLKKLKIYSGKKTLLFSNGAHLGFMYKPEFIDDLKREIALNQTAIQNSNP